MHTERNSLSEGELRPRVERQKLLPFQLKAHGEHFAIGAGQEAAAGCVEGLLVKLDGGGGPGANQVGVIECIPSGMGLTFGVDTAVAPCFKKLSEDEALWDFKASFFLPCFTMFKRQRNRQAVDENFARISSKLGHQRLKLVSALAPTLVKTHLFVRLAVGHGPVPHQGGVFGFAAHGLKGQDQGHERFL